MTIKKAVSRGRVMRRASDNNHHKNGKARANDRTTLLIHCSADEAEAIRSAARGDRRTISSFVLLATMQRVEAHRSLQQRLERAALNRQLAKV